MTKKKANQAQSTLSFRHCWLYPTYSTPFTNKGTETERKLCLQDSQTAGGQFIAILRVKGQKKKKETGREGWSQKGKRNLVVAKEKLWGFLNVKYFGGKSELF